MYVGCALTRERPSDRARRLGCAVDPSSSPTIGLDTDLARRPGDLAALPRRQLIHQAVQAEIKRYILEHRLKPGDSLPTEGELAARLGVSRNSVREAVKGLESLGIIEARAGAGLSVRDFSLDALLDHLAFGMLFDVRSLADILGVRLAVETGMSKEVVLHRTPRQLEDLDAILGRWLSAAQRGEYAPTLDRAFHQTLYVDVGNPLVPPILDAFWRVFSEAREHALVSEVDDPLETYRVHVDILEALRAGDHPRLMAALEVHHRGIERRIANAVGDARDEGVILQSD